MHPCDVECPYCGEPEDICHDNGYGEEGEIHHQECGSCGKMFAFTIEISFNYEVSEAPCLNGGKHKKVAVIGFPKEAFVGVSRCAHCGEEFREKEEERQAAMKKYFENLGKGKANANQ